MDYVLYFVTNFKGEHDTVVEIQGKITEIDNSLRNLNETTNSNLESIITITETIKTINESIQKLNEDLLSINVDANILAWVESKLENSTTIVLTEDSLNVNVSVQEDNAI
jgi:chromosome segregation ATPase